jgi:hypothetical protein
MLRGKIEEKKVYLSHRVLREFAVFEFSEHVAKGCVLRSAALGAALARGP